MVKRAIETEGTVTVSLKACGIASDSDANGMIFLFFSGRVNMALGWLREITSHMSLASRQSML